MRGTIFYWNTTYKNHSVFVTNLCSIFLPNPKGPYKEWSSSRLVHRTYKYKTI